MELPDTVISLVRSGQVVLFLGTGLSIGSQMSNGRKVPSEDTLRDELSKKFLNSQYSKDSDSLQWVAELAISETDLGTVQGFIAEQFQGCQPADSHLLLPTFRWKGIVTTNFDRLLETAYERSRNRVQQLVPIISNDDKIDSKVQSVNNLALLKLHGCITRTQDPKLPLILTTEQYSTHKESRDRLFKTFYEWCSENTVIFIGSGSQDSELRSILLQISKEVKNRPQHYLVQSKVTTAEKNLLESKGITILEGKFEDFINSLDRSIEKKLRPLSQALQLTDHPISRKIGNNEPIIGSLKDLLAHDVEYVHNAVITKEGTPQQFYKGFDLGWYPIINNLDVKRNLTDTIIGDVILRDDRPTVSELYVIKAEAGAGKTIFLRRLAWEAATQADVICLFMKTSSVLNFEAIRDIYRLTKERIFLFIDAAADNISLILFLLEESRKFKIPLTIITAARSNEWNMSCERLSEYVTTPYTLRYLSEVEISDLINLLEKHNALGPNLKDKNNEDRVKEFGEKAGRQLLVALHEATLGRPFREIIVDEYKHIHPKQAQDLYFTVCFLNRLGAPVRAGLIARVHDINFDDFKTHLFAPLEAVVQTKQKPSNDIYYLARHPQIAQIIFDEILVENAERYNEYTRVLRQINISYDSDRDSFRKLIKAKSLEDVFSSPNEVKAIYEITRECVGDDAYLFQQMANYERVIPNGNYKLAEKLLKEAQELDPHNSSIVHSQAELAVTRARRSEHPLERQKFRNQAFSLLDDLIKPNRLESDRYARITYLKLTIDELRYILEQENTPSRDIEDAIRKIEKMLKDTKQKYPEDTFVNDSEIEFAKLNDNNERILKALESSFKINPRDPYIAMRLSNFYKDKGNLVLAESCLQKALQSQSFNKILNYEYAQVLKSINPKDIDTLIYYFARSYSKTDQNYPAQFWYARYLFESSDLEKLNESQRLFKNLRSETIQYETRIKVRDYVMDEYGKKTFFGRVSSLQSEYGFVTVDGRGEEVYFHRKDLDPNTWDDLKTGYRISFNIGFTFNGAIANNIKIE